MVREDGEDWSWLIHSCISQANNYVARSKAKDAGVISDDEGCFGFISEVLKCALASD